jgi:hypothetical protein
VGARGLQRGDASCQIPDRSRRRQEAEVGEEVSRSQKASLRLRGLATFPRCSFCRRAGQVMPQSRQASKEQRVMRTRRDRGWFRGGIDFDEGPSACSIYPGGIRADSPGSRSAPRVIAEKENNPGGVEAPAAFAPLRGADSITTRHSPGACFARPGAIGSHPSGMRSRRRRTKCPASNGAAMSSSPFQSHSQGDEDIVAPKPFEERLLEVGVHWPAQFMEQCQ